MMTMISRNSSSFGAAACVLALLASMESPAVDWPRWRGPNLTGISPQTDWTPAWDAQGPKQLWKAAVGTGFSSVSVSDGRVFTMGNQDNKDTVFCFEAASGKELWKHSYVCKKDPKYYEGGTSCTPTVDGAHVFTLSRFGDLFCFEAASGKIVWSKNIQKELSLEIPTWGFAGSPYVEGGMLILNVGTHGTALDKTTGKVIWSSGKEASGYATPVPFDFEGKRAVAIFAAKAVVAIDPKTGRAFWEYPWKTEYDVNAADPIVSGTQMFLSSGYGTGGGLIDFKGGKPKEIWKNKEMHNQFNSCVLIDGHLYGLSGHDGQKSDLRCIEWSTGKVKWTESGPGLGSLMAVDGKLIVLGDRGELFVCEAVPTGYKPLARSQVLGGKCWSTPVLSNGRIYCRNAAGTLVCVRG